MYKGQRQRRPLVLARLRRPSVLGRRLARAARSAASYTHFRAHETALDLVCRLLLEKKKSFTMSQDLLAFSRKRNYIYLSLLHLS